MSDRYRGKFKRGSRRKPGWNYGWKADYFITICTEHREHWFGVIEQDQMVLSEIGQWVEEEWLRTPEIRPEMNLTLGEYVVMPNHFHGIITIGANRYNNPRGNPWANPGNNDASSNNDAPGDNESAGDGRSDAASPGRSVGMHPDATTSKDATPEIGTQNPPQLSTSHQLPGNEFAAQSKNLSSIVRGFKSSVTMKARRVEPLFGWQARYHDHVIQDEATYNKIVTYIQHNPQNWKDDRFY